MKKTLLCMVAMLGTGMFAQEHFSGINTSKRTGLLNANLNPAELVNLKNTVEINLYNFSANIANNKITFADLTRNDDDFNAMLFSGGEPVNLRADIDMLGPAFGFKVNKWAFAVSSSAKIKVNMVDVDVDLGNSLSVSGENAILGTTNINTSFNQRASATTWGEIGISVARELYNDKINKISVGATFNLLFPGSYVNMAADKFHGDVTYIDGDKELTNAHANLNFAYSGSLANDFTEAENFTDFFAGGLNGYSTDIGINYQWLKPDTGTYKINAGASVKNLGSMTFSDDNNVSNNYTLDISGTQSLNLNQFEEVTSVREVEDILLQSGYATLQQSNKDFKVKLPAMLAVYADVKMIGNLYVTGYIQQKLKKDDVNNQVALQNITTIIPRYSAKWLEVYVPVSFNEIAGFTTGFGLRLGGFFIGSGSALSAAISNTNQADAYFGFRFGF